MSRRTLRDPRPGVSLHYCGGKWRTVFRVEGGLVSYRTRCGFERTVPLATWRRWVEARAERDARRWERKRAAKTGAPTTAEAVKAAARAVREGAPQTAAEVLARARAIRERGESE